MCIYTCMSVCMHIYIYIYLGRFHHAVSQAGSPALSPELFCSSSFSSSSPPSVASIITSHEQLPLNLETSRFFLLFLVLLLPSDRHRVASNSVRRVSA